MKVAATPCCPVGEYLGLKTNIDGRDVVVFSLGLNHMIVRSLSPLERLKQIDVIEYSDEAMKRLEEEFATQD